MSKFQFYSTEALIRYFMAQGKEGECWDFKQEWHEDIGELMKDIICFVNTVHDEDCYIIFGVTNSLEVVGMKTLLICLKILSALLIPSMMKIVI